MSDRWIDRLSDYLDGELPAERAALEAHLETAPTAPPCWTTSAGW